MELAGAKLCFQYPKNSGLSILSFISERYRGIVKWIRESQTETHHFLDLWHIVKGMTKQLKFASKKKVTRKYKLCWKLFMTIWIGVPYYQSKDLRIRFLQIGNLRYVPFQISTLTIPIPSMTIVPMDNWNLVIGSNQVGIISLCKNINDYIIIILLLQ